MDPLTILGAAAAIAQIASSVVKGVLRTAQLFKEINQAPSQALDLLSYIEKEVTAANRLLRPDSPVFSQLSTSQYAQLYPYAIDARKALEAVQKVLQALEDDHKSPEGKLVPRVWKSTITAKAVRDIESDLKVIERLNTSLIRELNVSGFETQSVLRGQNEQILELASVSSARADVAYESLNLTSILQTQAIENVSKSITSFSQGLDTVRQEGSSHHGTLKQSIDSTKVELADVRQDLGVLKSNSEIANVTVTDIKSMVSGQSIILESLMEIKNKELVELIREQTTVKRTDSLLFKLFDEFVATCPQVQTSEPLEPRSPEEFVRAKQGKQRRLLLWNKEATERHMTHLVRSIREVISSGRASGSDVDEQGHTLLMEIFYLIFLFRHDANHYSIYLMDLLELARISQVDPMAVAPMNYAYCPDVYYAWPKSTKSTAHYLYYVMEFSNLSDQFVARIMEQYDGIIDSFGEQEQGSWQWGSLKLFTHHPSIAEEWGYSRRRLAIIRRSLADLRDSFSEGDVRYNDRFQFSDMELAVGWFEGLRFLVESGHNIVTGLKVACMLEDFRDMDVILIEGTLVSSTSGVVSVSARRTLALSKWLLRNSGDGKWSFSHLLDNI
ncbi:hypothetical protein SCUP234_13077 [Seiridium cupressi]